MNKMQESYLNKVVLEESASGEEYIVSANGLPILVTSFNYLKESSKFEIVKEVMPAFKKFLENEVLIYTSFSTLDSNLYKEFIPEKEFYIYPSAEDEASSLAYESAKVSAQKFAKDNNLCFIDKALN